MVDVLFDNIHVDNSQLKGVKRISECEDGFDERLHLFKQIRETLLKEIEEGE